MKNYCAYDLSRKRYMSERHKKRISKKAKKYLGYSYESYPKRMYRSGHGSGNVSYPTYRKRECNRLVRRIPVTIYIPSGCVYKKLFEYWWEID